MDCQTKDKKDCLVYISLTEDNLEKCPSDCDTDRVVKNKERKAIILVLLVGMIWTISAFNFKILPIFFPENFSTNTATFWRSLSIAGIAYLSAYFKGIRITPYGEIKNKFWFLSRTLGNYLSIAAMVMMYVHLRASTAACFSNASPIIMLYLSVIVLKEKFYSRYLVGIILCFAGNAMIVLNERRSVSPDEIQVRTSTDTIIGTAFGILHTIVNAYQCFAQKVMVNENIELEVQNYYTGIYNAGCALIVCLYEMNLEINMKYILVCLFNGVFFHIATSLSNIALTMINLSKIIPLFYSTTVYTYILGLLIFHEPIYSTDVIGSLMIIWFNIYHTCVPIN